MALNSLGFAETYSKMSDDELLRIEADRDSLVLEAKEALDQELKKRKIAIPDSEARARKRQEVPSNIGPSEVVVTDIRMPFLSMVVFMVKWAIASIPAFIILTILAALAWGLILGAVLRPH